MEREGNNMGPKAPTEQPQAPDSNAALNTNEASSPAVSPDASNSTGNAQTEVATTASTSTSRTRTKKPFIIAGVAAIAVIFIAGIVALVVNLGNTDKTDGGSGIVNNEDIEPTAKGEEIKTQAEKLADDSNINGMIEYINGVIDEYNNGTNYQDLTKTDIGLLCAEGIEKIYNYFVDNQDQIQNYGETILKYAYTEDSMLKTAESATAVYFAEQFYGKPDTAEQYKQIAIARGSKIWEINREKEE